MRKANVKLKNKNGEEEVYNDISVILLETDTNEKATYSYGVMSTGEVVLDFSNGHQEVEPDDEELYNKVIIQKPATLIPENIAEGVEIAGLLGTFEGAGNKPQLRTVTISRSGDTISISNPSTNGSYVKSYNIYLNDELVKNQTGTSFSIISFNTHGEVKFEVTAVADLFLEAEKSTAVTTTTHSLTQDLENLTTSNSNTLIVDALTYSTKLAPVSGMFLPEDIELTMGGELCEYEWNSYEGNIKVASVKGDIGIKAIADEAFKLRRPKYSWNKNILSVGPERYADITYVYLDGEIVQEIVNTFEFRVEPVENATYGFEFQDNGYYKSKNGAVQSSYAMCKVWFKTVGAKEVHIQCINYNEANYDYGIISQVNQTLSMNSNDDGSTGSTTVFHNFKGESSTTPVILSLPIPDGESYIYIKFRKDGSVDSGYDSFQFFIIDD